MTFCPDQKEPEPNPADITPPGRRRLGCAFEILETLALTLVIYLIIHTFIAQPFQVEQHSMEATIVPSDYVLIEKVSPLVAGYQRGDVVVFEPPAGYERQGIPFIKRIIGLPGDHVQLANGGVLVTPSGGATVRLDEPYVARASDGNAVPTLPEGSERKTEWDVPAGMLLVMGDNRRVSEDSRAFGPISRDAIIGRAWLRYFPLDRIGFIERATYPKLVAQP